MTFPAPRWSLPAFGLLLALLAAAPAAAEDRRLSRSGYLSVTLDPVLHESNLWESTHRTSLEQTFRTQAAAFGADLVEGLEETAFLGRLRLLPGYHLEEQESFRESGTPDTFLITVDLRSRYGLSEGSSFAACLSAGSCFLLAPFDLFTFRATTEASVNAFYVTPDGRKLRLVQSRYETKGEASGDFFDAMDMPHELAWITRLTDAALDDLRRKILADLPPELLQQAWTRAGEELGRPPAGGKSALGLPPEVRLTQAPAQETTGRDERPPTNPHAGVLPVTQPEPAGHPAVASIPRESAREAGSAEPPSNGQPAGLEAMVRQVGRSVFKVRTPEGTGSGFVFSSRGYGFTALHVVTGASAITIRFHSGRELPAKVILTEPKLDLAVLAFAPGDDLVPLPLGDSDRLAPGDPIVAIGYPLDLGLSVVPGAISAVIPHVNGSLLQIDTLLQPGSSGGPLLNAQGEGIGITFRGTVGSSRGFSYAVSSSAARNLLGRLPEEP